MSIRIGLIGCGEHSEIGHAVPLARFSGKHPGALTLAAVCDLRRERAQMFCQKFGFVRDYADLGDMLAKENLDVCVAVVPVEAIPEIGIRLLHSNVTCVVEKPLGTTIAEVQKLMEASRATNTANMVSVNRRFMPLLNRGLEWARKAGTLRYVRATMLRHERTEPEFLRFTAIHALDTVRFIGGDFAAIKIGLLTTATPRWYAIDMRFESGVMARIDVLPTAGVLEETYELFGDSFRVTVTSPFGPQRILRCFQQNQLVIDEIADEPEDVIFGFYGEVEELVDALRHSRRPRPSIEEVYPSVRTCFELADRIAMPPGPDPRSVVLRHSY